MHFFDPAPDEAGRISRRNATCTCARAVQFIAAVVEVGDPAYEFEAEIEIDAGARGGLLLFYDRQLYCGLGRFDEKNFITHQYGIERGRPANPHGRHLWMRVRNDRHIVSFFTSSDRKQWQRFDRGMEVSGYHHNVRGGFHMLKPGLYSAGGGEVVFQQFTYRALG